MTTQVFVLAEENGKLTVPAQHIYGSKGMIWEDELVRVAESNRIVHFDRVGPRRVLVLRTGKTYWIRDRDIP